MSKHLMNIKDGTFFSERVCYWLLPNPSPLLVYFTTYHDSNLTMQVDYYDHIEKKRVLSHKIKVSENS